MSEQNNIIEAKKELLKKNLSLINLDQMDLFLESFMVILKRISI